MYTGSSSYSFDWGEKKRKRPTFPFLLHQPSKMETLHERMFGLFRTCTLVAAATASTAGGGGKERKRPNFPFLLHQPSKMETLHERMFGLFRTCTLVAAATASTAGGGGGGVRNGKDPISLFCCISLPKWKDYMKSCWVFSVISSQPHWENYYFPPSWYAQLSRMVQVSAW